MNITYIPLKELIPYANNAKEHDAAQVKNLALSLDRYGWKQPVVVDRNNVIVAGHGRVLAAKKSKRWCDKPVPCIIADDLTDEQIAEFRLVDNKSAESEWDMEKLAEELFALDLSAFDFDWGLPETAMAEVTEDEAPEVDEESEPVTKLGDIWQLGRHRLMCGDSTSTECVQKLMGGGTGRYFAYRPAVWC